MAGGDERSGRGVRWVWGLFGAVAVTQQLCSGMVKSNLLDWKPRTDVVGGKGKHDKQKERPSNFLCPAIFVAKSHQQVFTAVLVRVDYCGSNG